MKCDNCEDKALYTCADPGVNPVSYCAACLPAWLNERALAGQFPLVEKKEDKKEEKAEDK